MRSEGGRVEGEEERWDMMESLGRSWRGRGAMGLGSGESELSPSLGPNAELNSLSLSVEQVWYAPLSLLSPHPPPY